MDDWDMDFHPDMIDGTRDVVINCQTESDALACAEVLDDIGVRYGNGESATHNLEGRCDDYKADFCFYVSGHRLYFGPKRSTYDHPWCNYEKCTFNGLNVTDISDTSFEDVIGGGE